VNIVVPHSIPTAHHMLRTHCISNYHDLPANAYEAPSPPEKTAEMDLAKGNKKGDLRGIFLVTKCDMSEKKASPCKKV
jgi:hypothetical protein